MQRIFSFWGLSSVLVFVLFSCAPARQMVKQPDPAVPQYDAHTLFDTVTMFGSSFSHDEERLLVTSSKTGVYNAYALPVDGGTETSLTESSAESIIAVSYFPHDDRILYQADQGGNELSHLFVRELDGREIDLTPGQGFRVSFWGWSKDKKSFFVVSSERNQKFFDLYQFATDGYEKKSLFTNKDGWEISRLSHDGRWLVLMKQHNNRDNDIYLWDAQKPGQAPRLLSSHQGMVRHRALCFSPDQHRLFYTTDQHGEFQQAWSVGLEDGKHQVELQADWDVVAIQFSENGRYRVEVINQDARTRVQVIDTKDGSPISFPQLPAGDITGIGFSDSESKLAFYLNDDTSPANLFLWDLPSNHLRQLSHNLNPAVDRKHLVGGKVVRYPSFDQRKIPAILYQPHNSSPAKPVPALVWVHGGPGGQSRHGYRSDLQFLANHGYAILAVNNRGSAGYGKTFFHLDDQRHGEDDLKDCVWARRYLETLDWVDGRRIGIIGGSYGGYMVLAALAFTPDEFDAGVDIFGVSNWLRTLKEIPPWWETRKKFIYSEMGDPNTDAERLRRISPLFHAQNIRKPLLVIQGKNDPRVQKPESDEIVAAVKKNGVPVEYVVIGDEGHGFKKKDNQILYINAALKFLDRYLKGKKD